MEFLSREAERYAQQFTDTADALLEEVASFTIRNRTQHANMLSGAVQGRLLEFLSRMKQPMHILEIGTFTGYSALCLAKGLHPEGRLHTIELRDADADAAQHFFAKSLHASRIILHRGNALDIIPSLDIQWDMVFIDADKVNYINYYELTLPRLKDDGVIIADNVLFHGEVLTDPVKGKNAVAIHAFNNHVAADNRIRQVLLTVRDGLMVIMKK